MWLIPSVTTILALLAKPALKTWMRDQVCQAAYKLHLDPTFTLPPYEEYKNILITEADKPGSEAADKGKTIHYAIECCIKGETPRFEFPEEILPYLEHVYGFIKTNNLRGTCEAVAIHEHEGMAYAGTIDLDDGNIITDHKTQNTKNGKFTIYPEWKIQLGGYTLARPGVETVRNFLISSTEVGVMEFKTYEKEELRLGQSMFINLLSFYYSMKGLK
jgi:hypothetical protein